MNNEQLAALRALAENATPGQWRFENVKHGNGLELVTSAISKYGLLYAHSDHGNPRLAFRRAEDMDYIAAANPATIVQLIDHIDALTARIVQLENTERHLKVRIEVLGIRARELYAKPPSVAVPDDVAKAIEYAVSAIYFADSSDYLTALWSILRTLSPEIAALAESDGKSAWERSVMARAKYVAAPKPATHPWPEDTSDYGSRIAVVGQNGKG